MVTRTRSGHPILRDQLDRFETVIDFHRIGAGEKFVQVTGKGEARHLRPVAVSIVGTPTWFYGVEVVRIQGGGK